MKPKEELDKKENGNIKSGLHSERDPTMEEGRILKFYCDKDTKIIYVVKSESCSVKL